MTDFYNGFNRNIRNRLGSKITFVVSRNYLHNHLVPLERNSNLLLQLSVTQLNLFLFIARKAEDYSVTKYPDNYVSFYLLTNTKMTYYVNRIDKYTEYDYLKDIYTLYLLDLISFHAEKDLKIYIKVNPKCMTDKELSFFNSKDHLEKITDRQHEIYCNYKKHINEELFNTIVEATYTRTPTLKLLGHAIYDIKGFKESYPELFKEEIQMTIPSNAKEEVTSTEVDTQTKLKLSYITMDTKYLIYQDYHITIDNILPKPTGLKGMATFVTEDDNTTLYTAYFNQHYGYHDDKLVCYIMFYKCDIKGDLKQAKQLIRDYVLIYIKGWSDAQKKNS